MSRNAAPIRRDARNGSSFSQLVALGFALTVLFVMLDVWLTT